MSGRRRTIQYAIENPTGVVISRVGSEIAYPARRRLEKLSVYALAPSWRAYRWTRKIPRALKNRHRKFWGMPPLKPVKKNST